MNRDNLLPELQYKAVRSSGAGGQHVNKVSSKMELTFDLLGSKGLSEPEKERIRKKLAHRLTKDHLLILQADDHRSQHRNKALVTERFFEMLEDALKVRKKRKKSRPTRSSIEKRLRSKKKAAQKKVHRRRPDID